MTTEPLKESDVKYLEAVIMQPDPVTTATEVANAVGVTQQAAHSKLKSLEDRGLVNSKLVGSRARVWWPTAEGKEAYANSTD